MTPIMTPPMTPAVGAQSSKNVDIVFCIDGSGSMSPCIDNVKNNALRFRQELVSELLALGNTINALRVKVITFRDYEKDGAESMVESRFFELENDDEQVEYSNYISEITAKGGGDLPENGLEALYLAMKSDWTQGNKDRQVIVLFTDADALELGERAACADYPADMVDMAGFQETWACVQGRETNLIPRCKRLVIFAPTGTKYAELSKMLDRCTFEPVNPDTGLADINFSAIIKTVAASVSSR